MGEIILIGDFFKISIEHSPIIFLKGFNYIPIHFYEQAKHIRGSWKIFTFLCGPLIVFYKLLRY
jgi:hypothetical protein